MKRPILILPILLSALLALPLGAQAQGYKPQQSTCEGIKDFPTQIHVNILQPQAKYDYSQDRPSLKLLAAKQAVSWATKNNMDILWTTDDLGSGGAYIVGAMAVSYDIQTTNRAVDSYGAFYCPYIKTANVDILYSTLVMVPSEAKAGSCAGEFVTTHADKHVKAASSYMAAVGKQIESGLTIMNQQMVQGQYVPKAGLKHALVQADDNIRGAVQVYYRNEIRKAITSQMKAIDTPESKAGLNAQVASCPAARPASVFQLPGAK